MKVDGSWFRVEAYVQAKPNEAAPEIRNLIADACGDRPVRKLVAFFAAPEDADEGAE